MSHINNFTALRWLAAGLVLYGHSFIFLGLPEPLFMNWAPLGPLGVFVFFSISGFLVAQSWQNDPNPRRFMMRRALRIFPGLIVCVALTIFPFGAAISTLDLESYLKHPATRGYFTNIYLYITYYLPGVFEHIRVPNAVNGSLWSLPAEFFMYILLSILGVLKAPRLVFFALFIAFVASTIFWALKTQEMLVIYRTDFRQVLICGGYFLAGVLIHKFSLLKHASAGNILFVAIIWLCLSRWSGAFVAASYIALPIFAVAFGSGRTPLLTSMANWDYSYGIYIYAFPVQQAVAYYLPKISLPTYLSITSAVTVCLACLSWHLVEKRALQLKPTRKSRDTLIKCKDVNVAPTKEPEGNQSECRA